MNKWTAEQRNQIILFAVGTVAVAALIQFQLIGFLQAMIQDETNKIALAQNRVNFTKAGISKVEQFRAELENSKRELLGFEAKMADGDLFRWAINFLGDLGSRHDINITEFGPPQDVELNIPPKVSYKAESYSISGTAYYSDFGAFVADLENSSPFIRLRSLTLQSVAPGLASAASSERLSFRLEFMTLVKPSSQL
ncbi:MAG: hypothetical protein DME18_13470 [Verrucomicrobia bacterium]|nr:MAG: hypothetical protein DME18_13470 [Verrucomicrobiota bacterium]